MINDYTPINYSTWNFDGQGKNILHLLNPLEKQIWEKALPLQDKRKDAGHAEIATLFSLVLTELTNANRQVSVLGTILHDIGYNISPEEFREVFLSKPDKEKQVRIRLEHQVRGGVLAYDILKDVGVSQESIAEILRIDLDHDTRFYETTSNGKIIQDADILWRVTKPCIDAYHFGKSHEEIYELSREGIFPKLNLDASKEIAEIELENSMKHFS